MRPTPEEAFLRGGFCYTDTKRYAIGEGSGTIEDVYEL